MAGKNQQILKDLSKSTIANGETGVFRVDQGDIMFAKTKNADFWSKLTIGPIGSFLISTGQSPKWGTANDLLNALTGLSLPLSLATNKIFVGNASNLATAVSMSGDATIVASGAITISNDAVTFAKMQNVSTDILLGRSTAGTGDLEQLTTIPTVIQDNITRLGTIVSIGAPLGSTFGGTSFSTYTAGDMIYASALNTLSKLTIGTNGHILTVSGGLPVWSTFTLPLNSGKIFQGSAANLAQQAVLTAGPGVAIDNDVALATVTIKSDLAYLCCIVSTRV